MKALIIASALLSGCASYAQTWQDWSRTDRVLYDASTVCIVTDYLQTESALDTGDYKEGNPMFGSHPSDDKLAAITALRLGADWYLAHSIPERWRTETFSIVLTPCLFTVIHNHSIGVRIKL